MIVRISDLMENYRDDAYDLPDPGLTDRERVRARTVERIDALRHAETAAPRANRPRRTMRVVLLAAALTALLSVTAYAVYQRSMSDRVLEGGITGTAADGSAVIQYSAVGVNSPEDAAAPETEAADVTQAPTPEAGPSGAAQYATYTNEDGTFYSTTGKNMEYEALKEWSSFFFDNDCALEARDLLDYSDPHRLIYGVGYGVLAEKLDAIAEKYGLRLLQRESLLDSEQELFDTLALEPFYPLGTDDDTHTIQVYDDGSFQASGLVFAASDSGKELGFNVFRAVRGSFTDFLVLGGDPALADFETYTTQAGTEVDIALEDRGSFLFADMENCHVTFWFYDGWDTGLTMAELEAAADSVDFSALDKIDTTAVAANVEEGMAQNMEENPNFYREVTGPIQGVYDELGDYSLDGLLPEGYRLENSGAESVEDTVRYMASFDGDGPEPGPADYYDSIGMYYAAPDSEQYINRGVSLSYSRYWGDPDRAVIRNAQAFYDRGCTSIRGLGYSAENYLPCTVGGFSGYYCLEMAPSVGTSATSVVWYDTDKQLLFSISATEEMTTQETFDLAEQFAASIREIQGPAPTGTVSDEVVEADLSFLPASADVSELGSFGLTPPEDFTAADFYGTGNDYQTRAVQVYANGSDPLAGYVRLLLTWERDYYEDGYTMEESFNYIQEFYQNASQDPEYQKMGSYTYADCMVNGMAGFVGQTPDMVSPTVQWLDTELDLWFTLTADRTDLDDAGLPDADALIALAQKVAPLS